MKRTLTASDRKALIRLASSLPKGSEERKVILGGLQKITAGRDDPPPHIADQVDLRAFSKSVHRLLANHPRVKEGLSDLYMAGWQEWRGRWFLEVHFKTGRSFDDAFVGDPGRKIMQGMKNVGRKYGLVFINWVPMEKGWGDFQWEVKSDKTAEGIEKTASQSKLRKSLDAYGKELNASNQIMFSAIKDLEAAYKSMRGLGMNMRRLAATPFGEDPQDFKYLYEEVMEQLVFVQRMLMSYRYVERVHDLGDEYDILGTLGVADSFNDQQDMERYWGTDYDTSKSFRMASERAMDDFKREYGRPPRVASKKMTSSGAVAKTILDQMGGQRRLQMMIGANKFIDLGKGIGIKWPNKKRSKGNYVEIKLTGDDLYDMTFYNVSMRGKKKVKEHRGLYFDMLVPVFEKQTGWYLRMGSKTAYGNRERGSGGLLFSTKPMFSVKTEPSDPPYNQTYDAMLIASGSGALAVRQMYKTYQQYKREIHAMRSLYEVQKFLDEKVRESGVRGRLRWHHWSMPD